ncbi:hypothetical protein Lal_00001461 [Lupinus albus]|nr:hypothetical protein Lal_00001461 [Lupinus albus]
MHFTATCHIPPTSSVFKPISIKGTAIVKLPPPTHPLNPINPDNAWILRITAAAGTELADPYSYRTFSFSHVKRFIPVQKQFTTRRAVFLHAAWLVQTCVH